MSIYDSKFIVPNKEVEFMRDINNPYKDDIDNSETDTSDDDYCGGCESGVDCIGAHSCKCNENRGFA